MANVIAELNRPTLILAHNKTLAAQLCAEFKEFFPENAVEFLFLIMIIINQRHMCRHVISTLKEKPINEEIERLRHSATRSLLLGKMLLL